MWRNNSRNKGLYFLEVITYYCNVKWDTKEENRIVPLWNTSEFNSLAASIHRSGSTNVSKLCFIYAYTEAIIAWLLTYSPDQWKVSIFSGIILRLKCKWRIFKYKNTGTGGKEAISSKIVLRNDKFLISPTLWDIYYTISLLDVKLHMNMTLATNWRDVKLYMEQMQII